MPTEQKPRAVQAPLHIHEAEFKRSRYAVDVPAGVLPPDAVQPEFYANIAARLKPWDQIELRAADGTWYMEVMVLDASRSWARVYPVLGPAMFTTPDVSLTQAVTTDAGRPNVPAPRAPAAEDFEVRHRGSKKWSVLRRADGEVIAENLNTKQAAELELDAHLQRPMAAAAA